MNDKLINTLAISVCVAAGICVVLIVLAMIFGLAPVLIVTVVIATPILAWFAWKAAAASNERMKTARERSHRQPPPQSTTAPIASGQVPRAAAPPPVAAQEERVEYHSGVKRRWNPDPPEGYARFENWISVAGVSYRPINEVNSFCSAAAPRLAFARDPNNPHDANAIQVIGCYDTRFNAGQAFLGYVPAEISEHLVKGNWVNIVHPQLRQVFHGDDHNDIVFDIMGPAAHRAVYKKEDFGPASASQKELLTFFQIQFTPDINHNVAETLCEQVLTDTTNKNRWREHKRNKAPDSSQKEILKFFGQHVPKKMTTFESKKAIKELLSNPENAARWEAYEEEIAAEDELFELANDPDQLEIYDCKKISKKRFKEILTALKGQGITAQAALEDEDVFFDKALEMFPDLEKEMF